MARKTSNISDPTWKDIAARDKLIKKMAKFIDRHGVNAAVLHGSSKGTKQYVRAVAKAMSEADKLTEAANKITS